MANSEQAIDFINAVEVQDAIFKIDEVLKDKSTFTEDLIYFTTQEPTALSVMATVFRAHEVYESDIYELRGALDKKLGSDFQTSIKVTAYECEGRPHSCITVGIKNKVLAPE